MKLVRDKIPEIIKKSGKKPIVHIVHGDLYNHMLLRKVSEELEEFMQKPSAEEAGDILEVLHSLFSSHNITMEEARTAALDKKSLRGGFEKKVVLVEVK